MIRQHLDDDLTPDQRVALVWGLSVDAWLARHPRLPDYTRATMPTRLFRNGRLVRRKA